MAILATAVVHDTFANNEVLEITLTGVAESTDSTAALDSGDHTGLKLFNYGGVVNTSGIGLNFTDGSTGSIVNQASGCISGSTGVEINSTGVTFLNFGSVTGFGLGTGQGAVYLGGPSSGVTIDNRGLLLGGQSGVVDFSNTGGNHILNSGWIEGKLFGINYFTAEGKITHVTNSGTIVGGTAAIGSVGLGFLDLTNTGHLIGGIASASLGPLDQDTIYNSGIIDGSVALGAGNDLFLGTGGSSGAVFGEAGNDHLGGGAGGDTLNGGAGLDTLVGKGGNDLLTGGGDGDHFIFDTAVAAAGIDTITDFAHGADSIELSHAIFTKTNLAGVLRAGMFFKGAAAHDGDDHVIYNAANGWLIYDANGKAAGGAHHFATLAAHLNLSAADFFVIA